MGTLTNSPSGEDEVEPFAVETLDAKPLAKDPPAVDPLTVEPLGVVRGVTRKTARRMKNCATAQEATAIQKKPS